MNIKKHTMENDRKRKIRNYLRFFGSIFFILIYIPHIFFYLISKNKEYINSDLSKFERQIGFSIPIIFQLLYHLHNNQCYRNLFYFRIGPIKTLFLNWYCPSDKYFTISYTTKIGKGMYFAHPFVSIVNAEIIGDNFSCIHLTTIGKKGTLRPIIGNNVSLGANVTIIGGIKIGDNVTIGAGSVVVKDIPSNCIAVGNPCKPIKFLDNSIIKKS